MMNESVLVGTTMGMVCLFGFCAQEKRSYSRAFTGGRAGLLCIHQPVDGFSNTLAVRRKSDNHATLPTTGMHIHRGTLSVLQVRTMDWHDCTSADRQWTLAWRELPR